MPRLRPEFAYEPHITLARNADSGKVEAICAEARAEFRGEFSDTVRSLDLLSVDADGRIQRLRTIALDSN